MNQKIIFSAQKTAKKVTLFSDEKPKKYSRKRSESERSVDSKRSKESKDDSLRSVYIKNVGLSSSRVSEIHEEVLQQIQKINVPLDNDFLNPQKSQKAVLSRSNANRDRLQDTNVMKVRMEMIETQIRVKQSECERLKLCLNEQRQKRRKAQNQKRIVMKQMQQMQKNNQKLAIQNRKLLKEKEYFIKQVQFLEKINYDQKTRTQQSFREKHMSQEIEQLRHQLHSKRTIKQLELQRHCEQIRHQRDSANQKFKSMVCCVEVLKAKIFKLQQELYEDRELTKQKILVSHEYLQLKQRYRRFIQVYKEVRGENWRMKKIIQNMEEDLVLSDSSSIKNQ